MNWEYFLKKWINLEFFIKNLLAAILDAILPFYQFFSKILTPRRPPGGRPGPLGGPEDVQDLREFLIMSL